MAFNINAQVILSGPKNIQKVSSDIRKQLTGINVPVSIQLDKNLATNISQVDKRLKQLNTTLTSVNSNARSAASAIGSISNAGRNVTSSATAVNTATKNINTNLNKITSSANVAGTAMQDFGKDAALAVRRFSAFTLATGTIFGFTSAVTEATQEAIKFQREFAKIEQVLGRGTNLDSIRSKIDELSTGLGLSANELVDVARTFAQTGQSIREVESSLTAVSNASLAPTFGSIQDTTEGAIAVLAQFNLEASQVEGVLSSLNQVSKNYAVESEDLISVIRRAGGVFAASSEQLGEPQKRLNELIGIFTAVRSTTRESADTIATGLRTIFTRLQRPQTIEFLEQFGVSLRATAEDAKNLGIVEGEFIGVFEALKRISQVQGSLDTLQTARLVEELGGVRQVGKLIPALTNFSVAAEATQTAIDAIDTGFKGDIDIAAETLSVRIDKLSQNFGELFREISDSSSFQRLAGIAIEAANGFIQLADAIRPILPAVAALSAAKLSSGIFEFGRGFFGNISKGGGAGAIGGNLGSLATGGTQQSQQVATQKQQEAALKANTSSIGANTSALKLLNTSIKSLQTGQSKLSTDITGLSASLKTLPSQITAASSRGGGAIPIGNRARRRAFGGRLQKFEKGGMVEGPSHGQGGVVAELEGGELVLPKKTTQKLFKGGLTRLKNPRTGKDIRVDSDTSFGLIEEYKKNFPNGKVSQGKIRDFYNTQDPQTQASLLKNAKRNGAALNNDEKDATEQSSKGAAAATKSKSKKVFANLNPASFAGLYLTPQSGKDDFTSIGSRGIQKFSASAQEQLIAMARTQGYPNTRQVVLAGSTAQYIASENDIRSGINEETAAAAKQGMEAATKAALNSPSLKIAEGTPFEISDSAISKAVSPLFESDSERVNSAQGAIQGYLLEGIVGAVSNSQPQSSESNFDFIFGKGSNYDALADLFGSDANLFSALTAADAKRSASKSNVQDVFNKSAKFIASSESNFAGNATFSDKIIKAANGRNIPGERGSMVPVAVSNGEAVVSPSIARGNLADLESARRGDADAISRISNLPLSRIKGRGTGTSDSITGELPANSFVLPTSTVKKIDDQKRQKLRVGGLVGGVSSAIKNDPSTAVFLGIEGSLLATSESAEELKSNLFNAALGLAFMGNSLKEFGNEIKKASQATAEDTQLKKRASSGNLVDDITRDESIRTTARDLGVKRDIGNQSLANASEADLKAAASGVRSGAEQEVAEANRLTKEANRANARVIKEQNEYNRLVRQNNVAVKNVTDAQSRLAAVENNRITLASQQQNLQGNLSELESKRSRLLSNQNRISTELASREKQLSSVISERQSVDSQLRNIRSSQGVRGAQQFSQGQISALQDRSNRLANQERVLTRQTSGGSSSRGAASIQSQIDAVDNQIARTASGIDNLGNKISKLDGESKKLVGTIDDQTKAARAASNAARAQRGNVTGAVRGSLRPVAAAQAARSGAQGTIAAGSRFTALASGELSRRRRVAGERASRIGSRGALSRADRLSRVAQIRGARGSLGNTGLLGTRGIQGLGSSARVGSGVSGLVTRGSNIAKAGLGGPAGIAALVAGIFGDAAVDFGTEKAGLERETIGNASGFNRADGGQIAQVTGGLKGGIAGAATGASIGLLTGPLSPVLTPVFAALGGLAGAINGTIKGLDEQIKFEAFQKLDTSSQELADAFDKLKSGAGIAGSTVAQIDAVAAASQNLVSQFAATVNQVNAVEFSASGLDITDVESAFRVASRSASDLGSVFSQSEGGFAGFATSLGDIIAGATGLSSEDTNRRVRQRIQGGRDLRSGENIDASLSVISDDILNKASEQFNQLSSVIGNSLDIDSVTEIASLSAGSFDDMVSALKNASDGSERFTAQINAFQQLAGTTALSGAKQLSSTFNEQAQSFGGNENRASGFFAIGKEAAAALADGLSGGQSFEEAGKQASDRVIQGLTRRGVSAQELEDSFGISSLEDLKNVAADGGASLTLLAQRLGVSTREVQILASGTNNYINSVEDGTTALVANSQKQRIANDLLRAQAQGLDAFAAALEDLDSRVSGIVSNFTTTASNIQGEVARIFSTQQDNQAVGRVNIFDNGGRGRSATELDAGVERVRASIGGDQSDFADLSSTIQLGNRLPQALKDTADQLEREGNEFTFEDVKDRLIQNIDAEGNIFDGLSGPVRGQLEASLESVFVGLRQGGDALGIDGIKDALQEAGDIQSQFVELSGKTASTLSNITNGLNTLNAAIIQSSNIIVQAARERVNADLEIANRRASFEDQFSGFRTGGPDAFSQAESRLNERTSILLNAGGAGSANVNGTNLGTLGTNANGDTDLLQRRDALEGIRRDLLDRIGEVTGVDTTNTADAVQAAQGIEGADQLISELGNTTAALEGTKRAIEEQTNETARLGAIESKLSSIQESRLSERQRLQAGLNQLQGAQNPQDVARILNEIQRPFIAASKALSGQALSVQEGAALQADLLSGNSGIVANAFRQQNPNASEEDISAFLENSLANFQQSGQILFRQLGLGADATAAVFGQSRAEGGAGATAKGETDIEKTLLEQADKIFSEQSKLLEGYTDQNTSLLEDQQEIYRKQIIQTTNSLQDAADAFANLRDKEQELLSLAQQRLEQQREVAIRETQNADQAKLAKAEEDLNSAREKQEKDLNNLQKGIDANASFGAQGLTTGLINAAGGVNARETGRTISNVFGESDVETRNQGIAVQLAKAATQIRFGEGNNSDEAGAFRSNLFSEIQNIVGDGDLANDKGLAQQVDKLIDSLLSGAQDDIRARNDLSSQEELIKATKDSIAAKEAEIQASQKAQAELKAKTAEEAASREAAKKAREESAKQSTEASTRPSASELENINIPQNIPNILPPLTEEQRAAIPSSANRDIPDLSNIDIGNFKSSGNLPEFKIDDAIGNDVKRTSSTDFASLAGRLNDLAQGGGNLIPFGSQAGPTNLEPLTLPEPSPVQNDRVLEPAPVSRGNLNVPDKISLASKANRGRTLEKQTTGSGVSQDDLAAFQEFGSGGTDDRALADFTSNTQLQDRQFIGGVGGGGTDGKKSARTQRKNARLAAIRSSLSDQKRQSQARRLGLPEPQPNGVSSIDTSAATNQANAAVASRNNAEAKRKIEKATSEGTPSQAARQQRSTVGEQQQNQQVSNEITSLVDAMNSLGQSSFAKDLLSAADKLNDLQTLNINFEGSIKPITVILNGANLLKEMTEGVKKELVPLISEAVQKQLQDINL